MNDLSTDDLIQRLLDLEWLKQGLCAIEVRVLEERFWRPHPLSEEERDVCEGFRRDANRALLRLAEAAPRLSRHGVTLQMLGEFQAVRRSVVDAADLLLARDREVPQRARRAGDRYQSPTTEANGEMTRRDAMKSAS